MVNHVVQLTSYPETIEEEGSEAGSPGEEDADGHVQLGGRPCDAGLESAHSNGKEQLPAAGTELAPVPKSEDTVEIQKRRRLEQAGIKVMPAAQRFARLAPPVEGWPSWLSACLQV